MSSPASRDPYAQYRLWRGMLPAITHSSTPSSFVPKPIANRRHNDNPTNDNDSPSTRRPNPTSLLSKPFTGRPPITLEKRTNSMRKALYRKIRYSIKLVPKSTPHPRCARLRIWYKDARKRRRELNEKAELTRQVNGAGFNPSERASVLFRMFATLHRVSVADPALSPISPPSRPGTCPIPTISRLRPHIGPLTPHGNFFSIDDPP